MNILPVVFKQICLFLTLNFSKGHTFLKILLPDLSPLWTPVLENMNLFSVQFCKGNKLSWGPCVEKTLKDWGEDEDSIFEIEDQILRIIEV